MTFTGSHCSRNRDGFLIETRIQYFNTFHWKRCIGSEYWYYIAQHSLLCLYTAPVVSPNYWRKWNVISIFLTFIIRGFMLLNRLGRGSGCNLKALTWIWHEVLPYQLGGLLNRPSFAFDEDKFALLEISRASDATIIFNQTFLSAKIFYSIINSENKVSHK